MVSEFDYILVYLDYGEEAITKKYYGIIETYSASENVYLNLDGRSIGMKTTGVNITYQSNGQKARSEIVKELIQGRGVLGDSDYYAPNFPNITVNNVEDDLGTMDVVYSETPFWDIIGDICSSGSRVAYIDVDMDFHYFEDGSKINNTEAVVEDKNLVSVGDYTTDSTEMVTSVRVYGISDNNVQIISTTASDTTNTKGIVKQETITNTNILTPEQAKAYAEAYANSNKNSIQAGTITSLLLPTLSPGEKVAIVSPQNNIIPKYYAIGSFKHTIGEDGLETELSIQRTTPDIANAVKSTIKVQSYSEDTSNFEEMEDTIIFDYEISTSTSSSVLIGNGYFNQGIKTNVEMVLEQSETKAYLHTISGDNGTWISPEITLNGNVSKCCIKHNSENIGNSRFFVSFDGGINFTEINSSKGDITVTTGDTLIMKIEFASSDTKVYKVGFYYSKR